MAKFCKFCGKELEEGAVCSCAAAQPAPQAEPSPAADAAPQNATAQQAKGMVSNFWSLFTSFVKAPVTVGKAFVSACNSKYAFIIMGIQAILLGLLFTSFAGKYNSLIKSTMYAAGGFVDSFSATASAAMQAQTQGLMFPLVTVFFVTAIVSFALACALAAILMLFIKIFKGNTTYQYMACASAVNSLTLIPFTLVALLLSLIVSGTGLIYVAVIASIGSTLGYFITLNVLSAGSDITENKAPYVLFLSIILLSVVTYFVVKFAFPMCLPQTVKTALEQLKYQAAAYGNGGLSGMEMFGELIEELMP